MSPYVKRLAKAFNSLNKKQKANLLWHLEKRTPICCGETACLFTNGKGGG